MSVIATCVRVTTKSRAVWCTCIGCGCLVPLAPDEQRCQSCRQPSRSPRTGRNPK